MRKILFITEKWTDADKSKGLSNSFHNIFSSFDKAPISKQFNWNILHFDELMVEKRIHINSIKEKIWDKIKPDIIVCTLLGQSSLNPDKEFFKFFKEKGTKNTLIWPDVGYSWGLPQIKEFNEEKLIDLHCCWAAEHNTDGLGDNIWQNSFTPEDPDLYYFKPEKNGFDKKSIDVCFLGSVHNPERFEFVKYIKENLNKEYVSNITDGLTRSKYSAEEYAAITRHSKIVVNFSGSPSGFKQVKGRVFEATASGALLLERTNENTRKYFKEDDEYLEYDNKEDLLSLIIGMLKDNKTREYIALNGNKKFQKQWTNEHYWNEFFKKINET